MFLTLKYTGKNGPTSVRPSFQILVKMRPNYGYDFFTFAHKYTKKFLRVCYATFAGLRLFYTKGKESRLNLGSCEILLD